MNKYPIGVALILFALLSTQVYAVPLVIMPPPTLTLDGMPISTGSFVLTGATGFSDPGDVLTETTFLDSGTAADDIIIAATIGSAASHFLIDVPTEIEVLHLEGFFDAGTPDLPPAVFDIIVGVLDDASMDAFTYFLPTSTSSFFFQITNLGADLGSEIDNIDIFADGAHPVVALSATDPSLTGLTVLTLDNSVDNPWFVGVAPATTFVPTGATGGPGAPPGNCPFTTTTVTRHGSTTTRTTTACPTTSIPEPSGLSLLMWGLILGLGAQVYQRRIAKVI